MMNFFACNVIATLIAVVLDNVIGDPEFLYHPVQLYGKIISFLDRHLYKEHDCNVMKILKGFLLAFLVIMFAAVSSFLILFASYRINFYLGFIVQIIFSAWCIACKSLRKEAMAVYRCLKEKTLKESRAQVSRIVGRDPERLDYEGVVKACIETVAESTTDGIISPMFYLFIGGPVLGFVFKAASTMDSMIAYKNDRYIFFGRTAARLDDSLNFFPARIAALLMIVANFVYSIFHGSEVDFRNCVKIFRRDRFNHASPNSAQTESVMAGALNLQLAGDAYYGGILEHKKTIGDRIKSPQADNIKTACRLCFLTERLFCYIAAIIFALLQA